MGREGRGPQRDRRPWKQKIGASEVTRRVPPVEDRQAAHKQPGPPNAAPAEGGGPLPARGGLPPRVIREGSRIFTISRDAKPVYKEMIREHPEGHLRTWEPRRSKLAAALLLGARVPLKDMDRVLYLGAASGTTVSHVADIVDRGEVLAVESSPTEFSKLLDLAERRTNILPVMGNARKPELYAPFSSSYDVIYQDIAQRDQVRILEANVKALGKPGALIVLMLKTRSIDVAERPETVARQATEQVQAFARVEQVVPLQAYAKEHWCIVGEAK